MTTIARKICMIGDFAVGKTSLVARCVHQVFSEKYLTTVGVKIDTKEIDLAPGRSLKLIIWDIAGTHELATLDRAYLRGLAGFLLVADGTRAQTLEAAGRLRQQVEAEYGRLPHLLLVNKADLRPEWEIDEEALAAWRAQDADVMFTSAKAGDNVEAAFEQLAARVSGERAPVSP